VPHALRTGWGSSGFQLTAELMILLIVVVEVFSHAREKTQDVVQILTHRFSEVSKLTIDVGVDVAVG
jgi:alpha-D-ribose 1-methylphosphonate 5-phosphate C-P lyase